MAWVAVDYNDIEGVYDFKPDRYNDCFWIPKYGDMVFFLKGSIKKLIGKDLTWEDDAVELKEE